jgi:hypothetical protein
MSVDDVDASMTLARNNMGEKAYKAGRPELVIGNPFSQGISIAILQLSLQHLDKLQTPLHTTPSTMSNTATTLGLRSGLFDRNLSVLAIPAVSIAKASPTTLIFPRP